jgi:hypothetical protein
MRPVSSSWLFGKRADLALFGGPAAAALLLLLAGRAAGLLDGDVPPWLFLLAVVFVDVAHVWSTVWRVYADGDELRARPALYAAVPASCYAAGVVLYAVSPLLFWRVLAYTAVFHFVRQQYGWVALYRRKNREEGGLARALDAAVIYGATVTPLLFWHAHQPRRFQWFLQGDFVQGLPPAVSTAAFVFFGAVALAYAAKEVVRARRGLSVSWGKNLVVATTALTWFLGIVVLNSDYAFTVTNVLVHGVPYAGLVWFTERERAAERQAAGRRPQLSDLAVRSAALFLLPLLLVAWLEEWGWDRLVWHDHGVLFPGPALDPGAVALVLLVPLFALPQATHYVLDGFIWKMRPENAAAARAVGLPEPA